MAIPIWPESLPKRVLQNGYTESYPNNLMRTEFDSGVPKVRRKSGLVPWPMTVTLLLTREQKETLEDFTTETLDMGALRFSFPHPTKCDNVEVRIKPNSDALFSFTSYSWDRFSVTLQLEVLP